MARSRRVQILLGSAAAVAAALGLRALVAPSAGSGGPHAFEATDPAAPQEGAPPPPAAGLATGFPAAARPPPIREGAHDLAPAPSPAPVRAVVRLNGVAPGAGRIVLWGGSTSARVVALAADGAFEDPLGAIDGSNVTLVVPGRALPMVSGRLGPAGPELHLRAETFDTLLSGVVLEHESGLPVPDLDLHLHAAASMPRYAVDSRDLELAESVPAGRLRAIARTDRSGRFEVRGLAPDEACDVLPASGLWFSTSNRTVTVGTDAKVTLVPAFRVSASVVADESGDPLPAFQPRLAWDGGNELGFEGRDGAFTLALPWWGDGPAFEVVATASAPDREPAKATAWIDRARPTATLELRLRRLLPAAKAGIAFEIAGAPEPFASQPFDLEIREPPGDGALLQRRPTERVDPTHVRATVPAGRWHLRLRAVDASAGAPDWKGVLDLVEGHETQVQWVPPR